MQTLVIPPELQKIAAAMGTPVKDKATFDAQTALQNLHGQFAGFGCDYGAEFDGEFGCCFGSEDSEFGGFFSKLKKLGKGIGKGLGKVGKIAGKVGAVASFAIPGVGPLVGPAALAGMAAADKLLGSKKNHAAAAKIVSNTKALAALGDPQAIRGAQVLATVSLMRQQQKAPPGKAVVPHASKTTPVKPFIKTTPQLHVQALALSAKKPANINKTKWVKFKEWFTGKVAA